MAHELFTVKAPADAEALSDYQHWLTSTAKKASQPPLTEEEKSRPYARYFRDPVPADPAHLAIMDQPCDPSKALYPEQVNDLLNPGYHEVETGWCVLPNGAGYVADLNQYPGITVEMIEWWFAWHCLEDLRYRIWSPPHHAGIMVSSATRRHILDPNIPIREKNWGYTHHVTENVGGGMENIDISFLSPADFGFDMQRYKEPNISSFVGGYGWSCPVDRKPDSVVGSATMCHTFRPIPGGIEQRTRFWIGYQITNGKPELTLPPSVKVPAPAVQGLGYHTVTEFQNLVSFLPDLYKEYGGKITV